jgi:hypothetical protein
VKLPTRFQMRNAVQWRPTRDHGPGGRGPSRRPTGALFRGRIGGVVGAGLFIKLNDTGADGFVTVSIWIGLFCVFGRAAFVDWRHGRDFQLGDQVEVKLLEVAPISGLRFRWFPMAGRASHHHIAMGAPFLSKRAPKSRRKIGSCGKPPRAGPSLMALRRSAFNLYGIRM